MRLTIEKLDHQGRGIGREDGKTIFVENALPGELVEVEITKVKKNIAEAKVLNWIQTSKERIQPECPYFGICGGCDLLHLSISNQNQYKEMKIKEILTRYGNVSEEKIKPLIKNEEFFHYRNKVTFHGNEIGLLKKKSTEVISIFSCLLAHPKINEIRDKLKKLSLKNVTKVIIRTSDNGKYSMVDIEGEVSSDILKSEFQEKGMTVILNEKVLFGDGVIYETMKDKTFEISKDSFFQVNTKMALKLYEKVLEYANLKGKETVFDLYCGTGTIGIFVSDRAKEVYGIEINQNAIESANRNKELNEVKNVTFYQGDVSKLIEQIKKEPDVVIVDPPRAGLDSHTIEVLKKWKVSRIVYVSCDPMTFARDLKLLGEIYEVKEVTPVDMFSNTSHCESVCVLERK